jgi:hypothetical protein
MNHFYNIVPYTPHPENILYVTSSGESQKYAQPNVAFPVQEFIIGDNVGPYTGYPFNTNYEGNITDVCIKANNLSIKLLPCAHINANTHYKVEANKNILFEVKGNTLYIWSAECSQHKLLTTTGSSVVDGYNITKYDGTKIKTVTPHGTPVWNMANLELKNIEFRGDNSTLVIDPSILDQCGGIQMKVLGNNKVDVLKSKSTISSLSLFTTYSRINFNSSQIKMADISIEGNCEVKGIECTDLFRCNIVGSSTIYVKISNKCKKYEEIFGDGKIIYL